MKLKYCLVMGFVVFSANLLGQRSIKNLVKEGDLQMKAGKYYLASDYYTSALKFDSTNYIVLYKYAKSLSAGLNYCKAKYYFEKALANSDTISIPSAVYELGISQKNCGDYRKSLQTFKLALELSNKYPELSKIYDKILHEITSVEFALNHQDDSENFVVYHLPSPINTTNSEFNPVLLPGGKLVFSSYRILYADSFSDIFSKYYTSSIYETKLTNSGWSVPNEFDKKINGKRGFTANICFANHYRMALFTKCEDNNGQIGKCKIYFSVRKNNKWTKPKALPEFINAEGYSTTQPNYIEGDDYDILYFVSNRPGGFGGFDIWYSIFKNNKFEEPSNLGNSVNTKGNEITPWFDKTLKLLYFSSDWHESFGGYDVFISEGGLNQWSKPLNMGLPVNSENNDIYYTPNQLTKEAYLSSNRLGSFTEHGADYCCSDLYLIVSDTPITEKENQDTIIPEPVKSVEKQIIELLPIDLYFDNDIPDPNTIKDSTLYNYQNLLIQYNEQLTLYKNKYSEGIEGREKSEAKDSITAFFTNYVNTGFNKLQEFKKLLRKELQDGKDVSLKIEGYASPLNTPEYNYHLSKRRISSIINYLYEADSGYFISYLQNDTSIKGSLTIFKDPQGDKTASPFVSNNPNDKRNSIYSIAAALERRIRISMYSSGESSIDHSELPILTIKTQSLQHDSIKKGKPIKGLIYLTNTGKSELVIENTSTETELVQFQPTEFVIKPGETVKQYYLIITSDLERKDYNLNVNYKSNAGNLINLKISFTVI